MAGTTFQETIKTTEGSGQSYEVRGARTFTVELTADEVNALEVYNQILPSAGAGKAIIVDSIVMYKEAGTAYTAAGNLEVRYDSATGTIVSGIAHTGFSDQATAELRVLPVFQSAVGTVGSALEPTEDAGIGLHSSGAISAGTGSLFVRVHYHVIDTVLNSSFVTNQK